MNSPLQSQYETQVRSALQKDLKITNPMQVPRIEKIVINAGIGSYLQRIGSKNPDEVVENITKIAGQKPVVQKAKLSVSNFKLREGMPVGIKVTLRKAAAYNFLYKLIHIVYPRVRDFRGVSPATFDRAGNVSFGFADATVFPEVPIPEDSRRVHGLQVTLSISGRDKAHSKALLDAFGFPFKKQV